MPKYVFCSALVLACLAWSNVASQPTVRFAVIGDYGNNSADEQQVATMVANWTPDFVITAGDNSYGSNAIDLNIGKYYSAFIGAYTGSFGPGAVSNRFFPSLGNHDYSDGGGINAYLNYFTLPGTGITSTNNSGKEHYYDFTFGPIQFFAINSNLQESDGITSSSTQATWLQTQLAASTTPWQLVFMHHPPYSSSLGHGSVPVVQWPYEAWGADIIVTGHDHTYERIHRDDNSDGKTVPYFVNGLGGRSIYGFPASGFVTGSRVRYNGGYGAQLVEANDALVRLSFYSTADDANGSLIDSYVICRCYGLPGNADADFNDSVDIGDLNVLVDYLFGFDPTIPCREEANVDFSSGLDISDLMLLIDHLFFGATLSACP